MRVVDSWVEMREGKVCRVWLCYDAETRTLHTSRELAATPKIPCESSIDGDSE